MFKRFTLGALAAVGFVASADAAAISGSASLQSAIEPVQKVACWRYGWRGWAVYPSCFPPPYYAPPPYVVAPPYYAPAPAFAAPPVYIRPPRRCWINGAWRVC